MDEEAETKKKPIMETTPNFPARKIQAKSQKFHLLRVPSGNIFANTGY